MSRKNFKVATDANGQTTMTKIDKTPTGKVKTIKDKEVIKKEREEQYKNFRIGALRRRAKRMGLSEDEIKIKVEELIKQIDAPNQYLVLVMFNPKDINLLKQALMNEGIVWKMMGSSYTYVEADSDTLATIREIAPPSAKIHPYVKKKPPILPVQESKVKAKQSRTKAQKKALAVAAKKVRKTANIAAHINCKEAAKQRKESHNKKMRHMQKTKKLFDKRCLKASKKGSGTAVQLTPKKASKASKKALAAAA